jgi:hypothetical protein
MRRLWLLVIPVVGWVGLASHGAVPDAKPKARAGEEPAAVQKVPADLEALNVAGRKIYADARARELASIPAVLVVAGDDLVLLRNGKRTVVTVVPAEYHTLKSVAHSTLALFTLLTHDPGQPLGEERLKALTEYHKLLVAAEPAVEKFGFDPDTLARQKRILSRAQAFAAKVLEDGKVSAEDLAKFCRASRVDVVANGAAAARAQLVATHKQVTAWRKELKPEEWAALTVVIQGSQPARVENAAVQYFARLFGQTPGEGRRIVYAEGLWDEEKALKLLGTLRLDGKLSSAVFGDPYRMYRDFVADGARVAIDEIFAAP